MDLLCPAVLHHPANWLLWPPSHRKALSKQPYLRCVALQRGGEEGAGQRVTIGWATDAAACCASRASATHQPPGSPAVAGSRMVVGSHGSGPGSAGGSRAKGGGSGVSDGAVAAGGRAAGPDDPAAGLWCL